MVAEAFLLDGSLSPFLQLVKHISIRAFVYGRRGPRRLPGCNSAPEAVLLGDLIVHPHVL
jgi:hypothetical protein